MFLVKATMDFITQARVIVNAFPPVKKRRHPLGGRRNPLVLPSSGGHVSITNGEKVEVEISMVSTVGDRKLPYINIRCGWCAIITRSQEIGGMVQEKPEFRFTMAIFL